MVARSDPERVSRVRALTEAYRDVWLPMTKLNASCSRITVAPSLVSPKFLATQSSRPLTCARQFGSISGCCRR